LASLTQTIFGAYEPDRILSLPGWEGDLPSKQYSGYLNVSSTHLHYWFVESENDPANAPTILWFNGGPGCSSLDGFIYEQGPFQVSHDGTTLSPRPYRWNLLGNTLFIESPVGVGFSYSDTNDYKCTDDRTASENLAAVEKFFEMFPEYKNNKFFITGESYAGVYVPTLAEAIVKAEIAGTYTGAKLTGIAVGNGCSGTEVGVCGSGSQGNYYEWQYLTQTAFVEPNLKNQINSVCNWTAAAANIEGALSAQCVSLLNKASAQIDHVNMYDIYGDCVDDMCSAYEGATKIGKIPNKVPYTVEEGGKKYSVGRLTPHGPDACIDSGTASNYLNREDVQAAIHVRNPGFCWAVCNTAKGWKYQSTRTNLPRDTYPFLVSNIQVLIYNGDWDACVPYTDGFAWTESMGFPIKSSWHNWQYTSTEGNSNQVAGYAVEYDVSNAKGSLRKTSSTSNSFSFITIRGGRHEVPESAPAQAFEMLTRVINNQPF